MKTFNQIALVFLIVGLTFVQANAQTPNAINYQGVVRNIDGSPVGERDITIRINILDGGETGNPEYSETHDVRTNQFGLYRLSIGEGLSSEQNLNSIDWSKGNKWMQVECNEGSGFELVGTQQLLSVPYAMYASKSGSGIEAGDGIRIENNAIINDSKDKTVTLRGTGNVTITGTYPNFSINVTDADTDPNNEIQSLSAVLSIGNNAGNRKITNVQTPSATDAPSTVSTKGYVDAEIAKVRTTYAFKESLSLDASSNLVFNEEFDLNNRLNASNGVFTVQEDGVYVFDLNAASDNSTWVTEVNMEINGGASVENTVMIGQTSGERIFIGRFMLKLEAGDELSVAVNVLGGSGFTGTFQGYKL